MQGVRSHRLAVIVVVLCLLSSAFAGSEKSKLSGAQREEIIRAFLAERAYAHRTLPLGKAGVVIDGSTVSPSEGEVLQRGTAAKAGERVQITGVQFVREGILFEINGGAVKHERWSDRIKVGMGPNLGPTSQPNPKRPGNMESLDKNSSDLKPPEPMGAIVLLKLDDGTGITATRVKTLLAPVLDFNSTSQEEAYRKNLSPVLGAALRDHRALVGMDRDMVLAALGRPVRRMRENADGQDYEEWIYGTPPQDVQFIRFVRGKVVRIELMKITGEKLVRTADEVGKIEGITEASATQPAAGSLTSTPAAPPPAAPAMAAPATAPTDTEHKKPPTLLRPGESLPAQQ